MCTSATKELLFLKYFVCIHHTLFYSGALFFTEHTLRAAYMMSKRIHHHITTSYDQTSRKGRVSLSVVPKSQDSMLSAKCQIKRLDAMHELQVKS